ncbi:MAG: hypothetical protein ACPGQS_05550 [Bradymonadia bacterium]
MHLLMRDNPPPPDKAGGLSEGVVVGRGRALTVSSPSYGRWNTVAVNSPPLTAVDN